MMDLANEKCPCDNIMKETRAIDSFILVSWP